MEAREKRNVHYYMRVLHRDIGFFLIGLTIIYCVSGILLVYRDSDFLKQETTVEKQLTANLSENELGKELRLRNFKPIKVEENIVYFENGTYDKTTGVANYTQKALPAFLEALNKLHKTSSNSIAHYISVMFGVLLLFLAISSFWMFKAKSKMFLRGISFAGAGILFTAIIIFLF